MKKCNNCGYLGLEDDAIKCKCGAVKINETISTPFYIIMLIIGMITLVEIAFIALGYLTFEPYFIVTSSINYDYLIYSFMFIFILQCGIYVLFSKLTSKKESCETTLKSTTFSNVEIKRYVNKNKSNTGTCTTSTMQNNSNSDDNMLTGIVIGTVAANLLSDNHSHNDSNYSDDSNYSNNISDGGF